jgi:methylated-DNA-[protein]-cysteine S-methyltransferase
MMSKKVQGIRVQEQMDHILDDLFLKGPEENMIAKAQVKLQSSLAQAQENAILYGVLDHPTTGALFLAIRRNKAVAIDFGVSEQKFISRIEKQFDAPVYFAPDETRTALDQIQAYLDGQRADFDLPTDISILTEFQQQVLQATQQIPRGRIATYMDIARKIGNPKAVRAVGQALGRNPIPIVIPCHRVIASDGSLGGYSGGGGLKTKAKLLQLEGASLI